VTFAAPDQRIACVLGAELSMAQSEIARWDIVNEQGRIAPGIRSK